MYVYIYIYIIVCKVEKPRAPRPNQSVGTGSCLLNPPMTSMWNCCLSGPETDHNDEARQIPFRHNGPTLASLKDFNATQP